MTNERNSPCYVGYCACGSMIAALVIDAGRAKDDAKEVAQWIRWGYRVERTTSDVVRRELKFCACPEKVAARAARASRQEALAL